MKFMTINAKERTTALVEAVDMFLLYESVGLRPAAVDHATITRFEDGTGLAIIVDEIGMMRDPTETYFFSIGPQLYAGGAIVYAYDAEGETLGMISTIPVMFYRSCDEVEMAINRGEISRPFTAVNEEVLWEWNKP
jgi:hypothetical protein